MCQAGAGQAKSSVTSAKLVKICLFAGDEEDENKVPVGLATLASNIDWDGMLLDL